MCMYIKTHVIQNKILMIYNNEKKWLLEQTTKVDEIKARIDADKKLIEKKANDVHTYDLYIKRIYERYNDILKSGKKREDMTNNDLWKIFEYFTCIKLTNRYRKQFYEYEDIDPSYKENN